MERQEIKELIVKELPGIIEQDEQVRRWIIRLGREQFGDREEYQARFDRIMDELAEQRKQSDRLWKEDSRRWEESNRRWEENQKENSRLWEEHQKESSRLWEEHQKESSRLWEEHLKESEKRRGEHRKVHTELLEEIRSLGRKIDSSIGALGARWGLYSEQSFRNGLKGILEENFGVEVINVLEYDDEGFVFGRPEQVELDIIIKNGLLIFCELKSNMDKGSMYLFDRKVRYYEKKHRKQATKKIVISPMVDARAKAVAERLGIEVYTHADDVASI